MRDWQKAIGTVALCLGVLTATSLISTAASAATDSKVGPEKTASVAKPIPSHVAVAVKHVVANTTEKSKTPQKPRVIAAKQSAQPQIKGQKVQYVHSVRLQCVPFARAASGIEIKGNAANWWDSASGVYARGQAPEAGSVLNFRSTRGMRLGHVAVVTAVISTREVEIDHANWAGPGASKGGVSRGMSVIDVSPDNSWTQVRVSLGGEGKYGSVYPTYGFIYDRPDNGVFAMNTQANGNLDEVAELPMHELH
ncbi:MAG: CHAP domain-containing protein [Acetobacteraceae bacterium]|nr:CHAP domain-containing protein [Acetobacteraceae bacterium]